MEYPITRLGILTGNTLICENGEHLTVYPYGIILNQFHNKFAYYQINSSNFVTNAVLYVTLPDKK